MSCTQAAHAITAEVPCRGRETVACSNDGGGAPVALRCVMQMLRRLSRPFKTDARSSVSIEGAVTPQRPMQLYVDSQFASPDAMSVFVALRMKRVAFELRTVDVAAGETRSPPCSAASLTSRVPMLADADFTLSESTAISEYLENRVPGGRRLYPSDVRQLARARQLQAWLRSDLLALRQDRSTEVVFFRATSAPLSRAGRADANRLFRVAGALLPPDREQLFDVWSIADLDLALMLNRLIFNNDEVPARLLRFAERQWAQPAVEEWMAQPRPHPPGET
jgi:glutathione S-transferase